MKLSVVFCGAFIVFSKSYSKGFHNNNNGPTSSSSVYYCYRQSLLRLAAAATAKNNNITIMKESHSSKDHDNKNNDDDIILRQQRRNYNDNKSNNYNNAWEEKWERTFDELQNYVYNNGMQLPHSRHRLRFWLYRQEKLMKRVIMEQNSNNNNNNNNVATTKTKVMTLERAQRLRDFKESIIVMKKQSNVVVRKRRRWDDWFESVLDYVEINKCLPTKSSTKRSDSNSSTTSNNYSPEEEDDPSSLYNWLVRQIKILDRMEKNNDPVTTKKRSLLTDEKIHRLKTLLEQYPEFLKTTTTTATTTQEKRMKWNEWFERVLDYVDRNECLPPKPARGKRGGSSSSNTTTTTHSSSSSLYNWLVRQIKILQRIENDPNFVSRSLDDEKNVHRLKTLLEQYPNDHHHLLHGDTQSMLWERKFKEVQKFINIHGHLPTPSLHFQLYSWIYYHQKLLERIEKKNDSKITTTTKKAMTRERMERLQKLLGSSCYKNYAASIQEGWEEKYMELKDFIQSHDGRTPKQGENHVLYHWLYRQKKKMKTTSSNDNDNGRFLLTKEREERLKDLLDQCGRSKDKWEERFSELEAYVNEHDKLPPSRHSLYPWLFNQRNHARSWTTKASKVAKSTVLTEERLDRLAKLTRPYEEKKKPTAPNNNSRGATQPKQEIKAMEVHVVSWETIFEELKGFLGTHGRLPTVRENERLHKWLYRQKRHMANREQNEKFPATLTDERVHRLKSLIDGDNALSAMEVAWEERFKELKEFVETNGTYPTCYSNISLYDWVRRQKRLCEQFERDPASSSSRLMVGDRARRFAAFIDEYEKKYQNASTGI